MNVIFDIGMVLSKGILISMLGVFLLMPALTLLLKTPLKKTRHKPLRIGGDKLGNAVYSARKPAAVLLTLVVLCGAFFSFQNEYCFTEPDASAMTDTGKIAELFGVSNPLVLLVAGDESDEGYDLQRALVQDLADLKRADGSPVIREVSSMVTTGAAALQEYSAADVAELTGMGKGMISLFFAMNGFGETVRADRLLAAAESIAGDNEQIAALREQLQAARKAFIGEHYHRLLAEPAFSAGGPMSTYDIGNAFRSDLLKVNLITLFAILLIVVISFRSLVLPLLLVFVIEGAIWITMGINRIAGEPIFFISYLICLSIQMGATIDYGILVSDQYRIFRRKGLSVREALQETMRAALPTVLTSGIILVTAGFITSIGLLISRGALLSVVLVLTLLPALLALLDRWIRVKEPK